MKAFIAASLLLVGGPAVAEDLVIPVSGQSWALEFDAPPLTRITEGVDTPGHVYTGTGGKLTVSLHVYDPDCEGGDSNESLAAYFDPKIRRNPYLVPGTLKRRDARNPAGGVEFAYLIEAEVGGRKILAFNMNYVFAHEKKWADLHVSVVQFEDEDFKRVAALLASVRLVGKVR